MDFSWDTVAQTHADNIRAAVATLGKANPLVLLPDKDTLTPNTDFVGYIRSLLALQAAYSVFAGAWTPVLIQTPGSVDWSQFEDELDDQISSFSNQYISFNHFSKMQNFQAYLQALRQAVLAENAGLSLSTIQGAPEDLFDYALSYEEYIDEVEIELSELDELLRWMVAVHIGEETYTTSLEIGATHFDQNTDIRIVFDSPKERIGYSDLSLVTAWIGFIDGAQ